MHDPVEIKVRAATLTIDTVDHYYVEVPDKEKPDALVRVLKEERPEQAIVFVRTKIGVDRLARRLGDAGVRVKALHGDMSQGQRDGVMIAFKGGRERLLIATDVAARGLDITGVSHVVNYDIPNSPDIYVHRIGRTGRAGESGRAITLITPKQRRELEGNRAPREDRDRAMERYGGTPLKADPAAIPTAKRAGPGTRSRTRATACPTPSRSRGREASDGIEPADVVSAVSDHTHLENDDVRNVKVLERFSFVEVPADRVQASEALSGESVRGSSARWMSRRSHEQRTMHTIGPIELDLFDDDARRPSTTSRSCRVRLLRWADLPSRDPGFTIQGGDRRDGHGGPGYQFDDEQGHCRARCARDGERGPARTAASSSSSPPRPRRGSTASTPCSGASASGMETVDAIEGLETGPGRPPRRGREDRPRGGP